MQSHVAVCNAGGQTVAAYCNQHQLKVHQYYYWQKKLQPQTRGINFIKISSALPSAPVTLVFANGHQLNFPSLPPVDYLKQLTQLHVTPECCPAILFLQ